MPNIEVNFDLTSRSQSTATNPPAGRAGGTNQPADRQVYTNSFFQKIMAQMGPFRFHEVRFNLRSQEIDLSVEIQTYPVRNQIPN